MNSPKFVPFFKHTLVALAMLSLAVFSGCDDDDGPEGPQVFDGTIMELIKSDDYKQDAGVPASEALDSLVKFLEYHDLDAMLQGSGPYTLFAPSNAAFINLISTPGFPADVRKINPDIVKGVLSYHVVSDEVLASELTSGASFSTAFTGTNNPDDKIIVNADGTLKTGSSDQAIQVVLADQRANNGVVHITNKVLIPQTVGASLTPILGTMAGTIFLAADFTNLAKVIKAADADFTEDAATGRFKISTWLAMPITNATPPTNQKGFTFFAPPNAIPGMEIFSAAAADAMIATEDKGRSFVLNHLVTGGQYTVADPPSTNPNGIQKFSTGTLTAESGKSITVVVGNQSQTNPYGVVVSTNPTVTESYAPIVSPDLQHSNGVVQVIAGALN